MRTDLIIGFIIATYKRAEQLKNCLHSFANAVQESDHNFKEVILWVQDDGSADETIDVIEEFRQYTETLNTFTKLTVIYYESYVNMGVTYSRNYGAKRLSEINRLSYISYCDSDDVMTSDSLSIIYKEITSIKSPQFMWFGVRQMNDSQTGEAKVFGTIPHFEHTYERLGIILSKNPESIYVWSKEFVLHMINRFGSLYGFVEDEKFTPEFSNFYLIPDVTCNLALDKIVCERTYSKDGFTLNWEKRMDENPQSFLMEARNFFGYTYPKYEIYYKESTINYYRQIIEKYRDGNY